jgi:hypothetical protein
MAIQIVIDHTGDTDFTSAQVSKRDPKLWLGSTSWQVWVLPRQFAPPRARWR